MKFFLNTLKSRLLFLVFIISLPGLFAIIFQTINERHHAVDTARIRAMTAADDIVAEQTKIIEKTKVFLQHLSLSPILLDPSSTECSTYLANILQLTDYYINLGAPNVDGQLLCNATPLTKKINVSDRLYIQRSMKERVFSVGQFQFDRVTQKTSLNFAYPIVNIANQQVTGAVVAVVSLDWWSKQLENSDLSDNSVAYISDNNGKILANYPVDKSLLGTFLNQTQEVETLLSGDSTQVIQNKKGDSIIFVNRTLIDLNTTNKVNITVGIPFNKELNLINSRLFNVMFLLLFFIFLSVIFAIYSINISILKPLKTLIASTQKLSKGEESDAGFLGGTEELVDLQNQFSVMAKTRLQAEQKLKDSQYNLQESEMCLSRHLQNTPLGTLGWNKDFICTEWNRAATEMFGYSAEEAIGANIIELIVPSDLNNDFIEQYRQLINQKGGTYFTGTNITKSGRIITCNWYNTLILNKDGMLNRFGSLVQDVTEEKRNQNTLNSFFILPMNLHVIVDFTGEIIKANKGWENILGYVAEKLVGQSIFDLMHPDDMEKTIAETEVLIAEGSVAYFENRYINKQGDVRLIAWSATTSVAEKTIYALGVDIIHRRLNEDKLKLAAAVFTHAKEAIVITDTDNNIVDVNDAFIQLSGYSHEEVLGKGNDIFASEYQSTEYYDEMWETVSKQGYWTGEVWNKCKDGTISPQLLSISSVYSLEGKIQHYIAFYTDITSIKEQQKQLEDIAHYDVLTALPNRTLLAARLKEAMALCQYKKNSLAVLFLDLDGFKDINDSRGHDVGDKLLVEVAHNMKKGLRDGDTLARFGGDEFVAVLGNLDGAEDCEPLLERLLSAVSEPIMIDNILAKISASIGVTIYPHDNVDAEQLLRHADQSMYRAKQEGKNRYHLFDMAQDIALKHQHEHLMRISAGIKNNEFVLYYQPKVNMRTGELIGAEALIRWVHPELGLLPPSEFLPMIERHELTIVVGEWVIATALHEISCWQQHGLPMNVSVNLEAFQLQKNGFVERLAELLAAQPDVPASALQLEVLETSELVDVQYVANIMHACNKLGVTFALDDFGTGYCSLTYLKRLPVNLIKIDQSFIRGMLDDRDDLSIVEGVIGLSKAFQRDVIAEGVETLEHGAELIRLGCYFAQGYGIARPMPADDVLQWASSWKPDKSWTEIESTDC